jgi:ABC-type cobalamin/Fe3+-siderophores transport system ATPase subunit
MPNKFEVIRLLREQAQSGKTIIISTHDLQTAIWIGRYLSGLCSPMVLGLVHRKIFMLSGNLNTVNGNYSGFFRPEVGAVCV